VPESADARQAALAGLRGFQAEAAALREALRGYEHALDQVCHLIEHGHALHQVMAAIGVSDLRAELVEHLEHFETARHTMRVACFRVSLDEGLTVADVARLWGISRQLVSRLINEETTPHKSAADDGHRHASTDLPADLQRLITRRTRTRSTEPPRV
jgi:AraC-like DNA-binding protein